MTLVYTNYLKTTKKTTILDFLCFLGPETLSWEFVSKGYIATNLCGAKNKGSKTLQAKNKGSITPREKFTFNICPAEFWTPLTFPYIVLEQCNLCLANSLRNCVRGNKNHKSYLKNYTLFFIFFFYLCKPLSFQRSAQPI